MLMLSIARQFFIPVPTPQEARYASYRELKQVKIEPTNKQPGARPGCLFVRSLTMTYFRMGNPHYHRRKVVSLSCSGWEGVGPTRYGRQTNWCQESGIMDQGSTPSPTPA